MDVLTHRAKTPRARPAKPFGDGATPYETRFAASRARQLLQWLFHDGSLHAAAKIIDIATTLDLWLRCTTITGPPSNGVAGLTSRAVLPPVR